jgi:hypothetical protein
MRVPGNSLKLSLRGAGETELRFACDEAISWIARYEIAAIKNQIASRRPLAMTDQ